MAIRPVLSTVEGHTRLSIGLWGLIVILTLAVALVVGSALVGRIDTDESAAQDPSPLPTPAPTVTATAGWWGDIALPTSTPTMTATATTEAP